MSFKGPQLLLPALAGLLLLSAPLARAQAPSPPPDTVFVVCVPDGSLSASVAPCPASPVASPQAVSGVLLSSAAYSGITVWSGPVDESEATNLALTCAGTVIALYLVSLGIGLVVRMIKNA